ncbi:hypothetical protein NMG60_11024178 [Bertholletia excelsa]
MRCHTQTAHKVPLRSDSFPFPQSLAKAPRAEPSNSKCWSCSVVSPLTRHTFPIFFNVGNKYNSNCLSLSMHLLFSCDSSLSPLSPPLISSSQRSILRFPLIPPKHHRCQPEIRRSSINCWHGKPSKPFRPLAISGVNRFSVSSAIKKQQQNTILPSHGDENNLLKWIARPITFTLFCITIGLCPISLRAGFLLHPPIAVAAPAAVAIQKRTNSSKEKEKDVVMLKNKEHKYSDFTRSLLGTVSRLLRCMEEVRLSNFDFSAVEAALREVKSKKIELQQEIMNELYAGLRKLKTEKENLVKQSDQLLDSVLKAKSEQESLLKRAGGGSDAEDMKDRIAKLEEEMSRGEEEYNQTWKMIGEIEDEILRRETMALSIGIRELSFIERECQQLVQKFRREMKRPHSDSMPKSPLTNLSRSDVQKELQGARRQFWEQMILPSVSEAEDIGYPFDQVSMEMVQHIKQVLEYSRDLQNNLEIGIRKRMRRLGDEKCFMVNTPVDEVVKGFPEVELKWMFGNKEVVVPKAVGLRLFHGWKKWREEAKAELKRNLLEDLDFGRKYVAERQASFSITILL